MSIPSDRLVVDWPLSEASEATTIPDLTPHQNDGSLEGRLTFADDEERGRALEFSGNGSDRLVLSTVRRFPADSITTTLWVRASGARRATLFSYASAPTNRNAFVLRNPHGLTVIVNGGPTLDTGISVADGRWHHVAVTWERTSGRVHVYVDGVLGFEGAARNNAPLPSRGALVLGQDQDTTQGSFQARPNLVGRLSGLRLYEVALTAEQVAADMATRSVASIPSNADDAPAQATPLTPLRPDAPMDATPSLLHSLPDSTAFGGRCYHYVKVDADKLRRSAVDAAAEEQPAKVRPEPTLQLDAAQPTSVRFGAFRSLLQPGRSGLVSMWVFPSDVTAMQSLLYVEQQEFRLDVQSGRLNVHLGRDGNVGLSHSLEIRSAEWLHIGLRVTHVDTSTANALRPGVTDNVIEGDNLARAELFIGFLPVADSVVAFSGGYEDMPLQFFAKKTMHLDIDSGFTLRESESLQNGFGGMAANVEIWQRADPVPVEEVAFRAVQGADPIMRLVPSMTGGSQPKGIRNWDGGSTPVEQLGLAAVWKSELPVDQARPTPSAQVRDAFALDLIARIRETGVPLAPVFSTTRLGSPRDVARVKAALADYEDGELAALFASGRTLALVPGSGGGFDLQFAPEDDHSAGFVLVEEYSLTTFVGVAGQGRLLHTLSLAPGETSHVTMSSFRRTEEERETARSVLDSFSKEASQSFEGALQSQQTSESDRSSKLAYHAEVSGQGSWGWGSVSASAGVSGEVAESRRAMHDNVASTARQHAETASQNRQVDISSTHRASVEAGTERSVEREISNINLSQPLTTAFYQVNQELLTILSLVGVRVGFVDSEAGVRREVPLHEARALVRQFVKRDARDETLGRITDAVRDVQRHRIGELVGVDRDGQHWLSEGSWLLRLSDVRAVGDAEPQVVLPAGNELRFSHSFRTELEFQRAVDPTTEDGVFRAEVPGLVMRADRHIVRTDAVVCESFLGNGWALDQYSTRLQEAEAERKAAEAEGKAANARVFDMRAELARAINESTAPMSEKTDMMVQLDRTYALWMTSLAAARSPGVDDLNGDRGA